MVGAVISIVELFAMVDSVAKLGSFGMAGAVAIACSAATND